ncbi:Hypothetical protein SMAX5B_007166 [Scophthalmus maximus]|uniref:Uncharacterized protein n=1 Tax=Scophthalmus maximus TaxID=52904 RepID=A0A2U9BIP4_SCOMX|nr:Hypothetical protein SMAX5B_007166 [Scophthalmus maximus]
MPTCEEPTAADAAEEERTDPDDSIMLNIQVDDGTEAESGKEATTPKKKKKKSKKETKTDAAETPSTDAEEQTNGETRKDRIHGDCCFHVNSLSVSGGREEDDDDRILDLKSDTTICVMMVPSLLIVRAR